MFPFTFSKSYSITNYIDKAFFTEKLINRLAAKFYQPNVAVIVSGYELVFIGGFIEVFIRLNWLSYGMLRITHNKKCVHVSYEISFVHMFWLACFLTFMLLCSILMNYFSIKTQSAMPQLIGISLLWAVYAGLIYLTGIIFDLRIGKTINEVELSHENISAEQLLWMKNIDQCSACGHVLEEDTGFCPDCGLQI